jgi:hypothetical protein
MLTVSRLRRKPRHFHCFTGLTPTEFDSLLSEVLPAYEEAEFHKSTTRSGRPNRRRKAGAGRPFVLPLPERLLMGLVYLRLYTGQSILSFLFDVDQSTVCRELSKRLLPILLTVLPVPLRDAPLRAQNQKQPSPAEPEPTEDKSGQTAPKRRRINTLGELLRTYPELSEVLLDATEQSIPQPEDKQKRKLAFSGKKQDHTIKTQIVATKELILHVFGGLPGCLHDVVLLGASGVLPQVPPGVRVRLDKAYDGAAKRYPSTLIEHPIKKKRGHQITVLGRAYNHFLSVLRMPVEHHFARLQTFGILAGEFRGRWESHEDIFCIVSGLLNFRKTGRFTLVTT